VSIGALPRQEVLADLLRVAALAGQVLGLGDVEEGGAERGDLLLRRLADVRDLHDRAQPAGGGDRLQSGDAGAEHDDRRRGGSSRRRS
jgi:hypothetical protein